MERVSYVYLILLDTFNNCQLNLIALSTASGFSLMMTNTSEELGKHSTSVYRVREDSEYVRLVISNETRTAEADILQPQSETRVKSFLWWIRALAGCLVIIIFLLIFLKWGMPFLFEKVLPINSSFLGSSYITCYSQLTIVLFVIIYVDWLFSGFKILYFFLIPEAF